MLEVLRIKNFAIIDSAEIRFKNGLNILSGETGAGKSIVIEAISLLLGSRASTDLVRSGCEEAVIEGLFDISEISWMNSRLEKFGFVSNFSELLIKRTVHRAGKHRISINGELATLTILHTLCEGLIDLCGQHEHQSLLKSTTQLELLDRYGNLGHLVQEISQWLNRFRFLRKEQERLQTADQERCRRADFLKFQIDEIRNAKIEIGEDALLQKEKQLLQSTGNRAQIAESILQILEAEENGILQSLRAALQKFRALCHLDQNASSMMDALERSMVETEEVILGIQRYLNSVEINPERLQNVQDRLSLLADLRRKYGSHLQDVLDQLSNLEKEYASLERVEDELATISAELQNLDSTLKEHGKALSQAREKISKLFSKSVTSELKDLKMNDAHFQIELSFKENVAEWNTLGGDGVQFLVQTNRGEPARPLGKIASGGELSRLMLAIRRVISDRGGIGVYLFDEIDSGIGGQTAFQVGKKLKSVSLYNQVICITHLPQVASFADHHLVVRKSLIRNRTLTEIAELNSKERKEELARMLGGPELTPKSLANASELLELATK